MEAQIKKTPLREELYQPRVNRKTGMKLPKTEKFLREGIKMRKTLVEGHIGGGFFSHWNPATYDHKTVYDLEEAVLLSNNGWVFANSDYTFHNLILYVWRDLQTPTKSKTKKK